jgi:hypothetical protein
MAGRGSSRRTSVWLSVCPLLRDQVEQLELAPADIDEMLGEITRANDPANVSDETPVRKPARRPLPDSTA